MRLILQCICYFFPQVSNFNKDIQQITKLAPNHRNAQISEIKSLKELSHHLSIQIQYYWNCYIIMEEWVI
jgi:hypothetical protein